jgi:hypothetical protein
MYFHKGILADICTENVYLSLSLPGCCEVVVQVDARTGLFVVSSTAVSLILAGAMKKLIVYSLHTYLLVL